VKLFCIKGIRLNTNVRLNVLAIHYTQFTRANGFFQPKVQDFLKTFVLPHHPFWKAFWNQKIKNG
jgi:hypothetical protein